MMVLPTCSSDSARVANFCVCIFSAPHTRPYSSIIGVTPSANVSGQNDVGPQPPTRLQLIADDGPTFRGHCRFTLGLFTVSTASSCFHHLDQPDYFALYDGRLFSTTPMASCKDSMPRARSLMLVSFEQGITGPG